MQIDPVYVEAVDYYKTQLLQLGLSEDIVAKLNSTCGESGKSGSVESLMLQFPGMSDAVKKFDVSKLEKLLQESIQAATDGNNVTNPELAALASQIALLHEFLRLVHRRKSRRIQRVVQAGHRRLTLGGSDGRINRSLLVGLEDSLSKMRE